MPVLATDERVNTLTDTASELDVSRIVTELVGENQREVSSNTFVRYLMDKFDYTVEYAKKLIYTLVEMGKLIITERYTLRVAA